MPTIFIDGNQGTTGLRLRDRLEARTDLTLLTLPGEYRKSLLHRADMAQKADIAFLCLPDEASRELVETLGSGRAVPRAHSPSAGLGLPNQDGRSASGEASMNGGPARSGEKGVKGPSGVPGIVIDASTAHRVEPEFAYGFPELDEKFRRAIRNARRIAVPGCHASGAVALLYPLLKERVLTPGAPISITSITGYSGGGKAMIAQYEASGRDPCLALPRPYAVGQMHKHLAEITEICNLQKPPVFQPIVCDFYSGMLVSVPLAREWFSAVGAAGAHARGGVDFLTNLYRDHYAGQKLISVLAPNREPFVNPRALAGLDGMQLFVTGNDERMIAYARLDNLGKGASGAAIQCMNLRLGLPQETGLVWETA